MDSQTDFLTHPLIEVDLPESGILSTAGPFALSERFLNHFRGKQPNWGPLGYVTYKRSYARRLPDGSYEEFWQTLKRVVEGTYRVQQKHCQILRLPWNTLKAQRSAQEMYRRIWEFKFTPPGRGLWMMGTEYVEQAGSAPLCNCSFVSTSDLKVNFASPFCFLMDMSMLGVGVGVDTKGAGTILVQKPFPAHKSFIVKDSREGWVDLIRHVLGAYVRECELPVKVDYRKVRPLGSPIKGFGGTASGPGPLRQLVKDLQKILTARIGQKITSSDIVDIFNLIAKCVVSGNVRRSATLVLGDPNDQEFRELKDPTKHAEALQNHRWASNNSILANVGMDYTTVADSSAVNGEPGYVWLDTIRGYSRLCDPIDNKDINAAGVNPCSEQSLESYELCVAGATLLHTRDNVVPIATRVGIPTEIWNGEEWSEVVPFLVGKDVDVYRVTLSDGSYLDVTAKHGWSVKRGRGFKRVETSELKLKDQLERFELGEIEGINEPHAYEYGLLFGDGYLDWDIPMFIQCKAKKLTEEDVSGKFYKEEVRKGYNFTTQRVNFKGVLDVAFCRELRGDNLPPRIWGWNSSSLLQFLAGLLDTDGTSGKVSKKAERFEFLGSEQKMRDIQILLRRVGVNFTSVFLQHPAGETLVINGRTTVRKMPVWGCRVHSFQCGVFPTRLRKISLVGERFHTNNRYPHGKKIDTAGNQYVKSIVPLGKQDVFCFSEEKRHMGVFGNVLTYQCNLVESYPAHHDSYEDFERTLKFAYLYAKTITLMPTHDPRTNAVMLRNRRIGTSQSGIVQSFAKHGRRTHFEWCKKGYAYLEKLDKKYSSWLCIPESKKRTSVKPSGSVSLLAGATPGVHFPESEYYIRNIRLEKGSKLAQILEEAGYLSEDDCCTPNTTVVSFPVHEKYFSRGKADVSMWEQLEIVAQMQQFWADNQVSATIHFKPEEAKDIKNALELYEVRLKGICFSPLGGFFKQAPYIPIIKERFEELSSNLKPYDLTAIRHEVTERFCDSDHCEIPVKTT